VDQQGKYSGRRRCVWGDRCPFFDDPEAVEFRNLNAKDSQHYKPEIDILSRNTTWTISRDTSVGLEVLPTVFTTVKA